MSPHETLLAIQEMMDGVEWTTDTLDGIANLLNEAGYTVRDLDELERQLKPYQEGQWFFLLVPGYDHDEDNDVERKTPIGSLVCITKAIQGEDNYSVECPETEGWFFMDAEEITTSLMPVPTVYDALPAEDDNSVMDRYTVFSSGEIASYKERYDYLGCSVGGLAVSMWGEIKHTDIAGDFDSLGRRVSMAELDEGTQRHIFNRFKD